jgi:hypothetical protein
VIGCTATAGRLRLGSLGLESDALGSPSALWARDRDNQLFRDLGQRRVRADAARETLDCLDLGDGRDSAVDGSFSRRRQLEKAGRTSRTLVALLRHTTCERISSWGSLVPRRRGSLEFRDRWRGPRELRRGPLELSPSSDSRYSWRTRYRRPTDSTDSTDSSFDDEFGEFYPCRRRGGLLVPRSTLGGLERVPDRSARSRSLLLAFASES